MFVGVLGGSFHSLSTKGGTKKGNPVSTEGKAMAGRMNWQQKISVDLCVDDDHSLAMWTVGVT